MQRWKHRPEGSNWGDFGPDDQLGRLNLITEEQVLKGAARSAPARPSACRCRWTCPAATCSTRAAIRRS